MIAESWGPVLIAIAVVLSVVAAAEDRPVVGAAVDGSNRLNEALRHYDLLSISDIRQRRVKRTASSDTKHLEFNALDRHFRMKLWTHRGVLAPGFRLVSLDAENNEREIPLDKRRFYHGKLEDDEDSQVSAYEDDDGSFTATIRTKEAVYSIEPSWRHIPNSNKSSMIAYRNTDVDVPADLGDSYCGFVRPEEQFPDLAEQLKKRQEEDDKQGERVKRADPGSPRKSTCPLLLAADYRFFKEVGQESQSSTASYLIGLIDRVDNIYRNTDFGNGYRGMGFEIKEIRVHETHTSVAGGGRRHYNEEMKGSWDTRELLEVFSRDGGFREFCLSHLFTYQAFSGGVLGLAYIGSVRPYSVGGICSPVYHKGGFQLYLNTGWSSGLNKHNRRLLTQEADLVTTHGHNWGSEHDPDKCSPESSKGGKYIMYTYSVSGYEANNKVFSPCSRTSIGQVLDSKSSNCFREPSGILCGNSKVERQLCEGDNCDTSKDEECDAGPHTPDGTDKCCDQYCRLRTIAQCSDFNDNCCEECKYADTYVMCHEAQEDSCELDTYCTGQNKTCPKTNTKPKDTECIGRGKCSETGTCLAFCESNNLISCVCDEFADACMFCCRNASDGPCTAYRKKPEDAMLPLPDGMPCVIGSCFEGECQKQVQELTERFWDIIENITASKLVAFMRANIVGTVIVLSLVLWIPASCIVSYVDRKRRIEDEKEMEWKAATNRTVIHPVDAPRVRAIPGSVAYHRKLAPQQYGFQPGLQTGEKGTYV